MKNFMMPHGMNVILLSNNLQYYLKSFTYRFNTYCFVFTMQI